MGRFLRWLGRRAFAALRMGFIFGAAGLAIFAPPPPPPPPPPPVEETSDGDDDRDD